MPPRTPRTAPKGNQRTPGSRGGRGLARNSKPQSAPPLNIADSSPRPQDTPAPRAPEPPLNAAGPVATPFPLDQQNSTAQEGAHHAKARQNDRGGQSATSKPRKKLPRAGVDTSGSLATRESGMQVLCNSSNITVGRLDVTNVANGISAEELGVLLAQLRAITPVPRNIGGSSANSFILTDALGEELTLCCSSVQTYEGLERFLAFHFHNKIGEQRVLDRRYSIAQAGDGTMVSHENWDRVYELREPLLMSMSIEQVYSKELRHTCPKCGKTELGTMRDGGLQQCRRCRTQFLEPIASSNGLEKCIEGNEDEANDIGHFRHVRRVGMTRDLFDILLALKALDKLDKAFFRDDLAAERRRKYGYYPSSLRFQQLDE